MMGNVPDTFRAYDRFFYSPEHECLVVQIPSPGLPSGISAPESLRDLLLTKRQPYSIEHEHIPRDSSPNIRNLVSWGPARTRGGNLRDERYQTAPPEKDESFVYYMAQCLHYGLNFDLLYISTAKMALCDALAEDHQHILRIPKPLRKLEARLKARFERGDLNATVIDSTPTSDSTATLAAKSTRRSFPTSTSQRDPTIDQTLRSRDTRHLIPINIHEDTSSEDESSAEEVSANNESEDEDLGEASSVEQSSNESAEEESTTDFEEESDEESEEASENEAEEIEDKLEDTDDEIWPEDNGGKSLEAASEEESSDEEKAPKPLESSVKIDNARRASVSSNSGEETDTEESEEGSRSATEETDETETEAEEEEEEQLTQKANLEESSEESSDQSSLSIPNGSSRGTSKEAFSEDFVTPPSTYHQATPLEYSDSEVSFRQPSADFLSMPTPMVVIRTKRKAEPLSEEKPKKQKCYD